MTKETLSEKDKIIEVLNNQIIHLNNFYAERVKKLEEEHGIQKIQDNLKKSFKGTFRDALKNGYEMDKHYVIVDWVFFHELLDKPEIDKIMGDFSTGPNTKNGVVNGVVKDNHSSQSGLKSVKKVEQTSEDKPLKK